MTSSLQMEMARHVLTETEYFVEVIKDKNITTIIDSK